MSDACLTNLKRIMKRIEDQNGNIFKLVQDDFLLEDELAGQYSHIIFINFYRLDTTKKKLAHLTAAIDDFDMGLAQDARDLKTILVNHNKTLDEFRARQLQTVTATASSSTTSPPGIRTAFKTILKNMFGVGAGLSYNKELRDVFATLVEKIVEPCAACGWGRAEVDAFFTSLIACFEKVELLALHHRKRYKTSFTKLCMAVKLSAERLMRQ
ncbi:hypothetical protein BDR26DRAFT_870384 [Obelidium mucronatum]|nr:hypothetical protein BDR26DRAFT_870384 [Obelidium mucronatum]